MKTATLIGIFLLFLGFGALAYQAYSYTGRGEILELGPSGAGAASTRTLPVPPVVGVLGVIGGAALLWAAARSRRPVGALGTRESPLPAQRLPGSGDGR
jgi:hypothetical protein